MIFSDLPSPAEASNEWTKVSRGFAQAGKPISTFLDALKTTGPALRRPRTFCEDFASTFRSITDHESLVGVFGDLPPQIFIVAECVDRSQHLLEIGVLGRFFGVYLIGRL